MITDITVKIKNSEQTYSHKFSEHDIFPIQTIERLKSMIETAYKCMNVADNVLAENVDIQLRMNTDWQ